MVTKKSPGRFLHGIAALLTFGGRVSFALGDVLSVFLMGAAGVVPLPFLLGAEVDPKLVGALECLIGGALALVALLPRTRKGWAAIWRRQRLMVKLTVSSIGMNVAFYSAISSANLGTVTGLMQAVPTVLSAVLVMRALSGRLRLATALNSTVAVVGVLALTQVWSGVHLGVGVGWSLATGVFWFYNTRVSEELARDKAIAHRITGRAIVLSGAIQLGIALCAGASLHPALNPYVIGTIMLIGLLGTTLPNAIQVLVLGPRFQLGQATYTVLLNMGPVVAALFGRLLLHQTLSVVQWLGLVAVSLAAVGQTVTQGREPLHEARDRIKDLRELAQNLATNYEAKQQELNELRREAEKVIGQLAAAVLEADKLQQEADKAEAEAARKAELADQAAESARGWFFLRRR